MANPGRQIACLMLNYYGFNIPVRIMESAVNLSPQTAVIHAKCHKQTTPIPACPGCRQRLVEIPKSPHYEGSKPIAHRPSMTCPVFVAEQRRRRKKPPVKLPFCTHCGGCPPDNELITGLKLANERLIELSGAEMQFVLDLSPKDELRVLHATGRGGFERISEIYELLPDKGGEYGFKLLMSGLYEASRVRLVVDLSLATKAYRGIIYPEGKKLLLFLLKPTSHMTDNIQLTEVMPDAYPYEQIAGLVKRTPLGDIGDNPAVAAMDALIKAKLAGETVSLNTDMSLPPEAAHEDTRAIVRSLAAYCDEANRTNPPVKKKKRRTKRSKKKKKEKPQ